MPSSFNESYSIALSAPLLADAATAVRRTTRAKCQNSVENKSSKNSRQPMTAATSSMRFLPHLSAMMPVGISSTTIVRANRISVMTTMGIVMPRISQNRRSITYAGIRLWKKRII